MDIVNVFKFFEQKKRHHLIALSEIYITFSCLAGFLYVFMQEEGTCQIVYLPTQIN